MLILLIVVIVLGVLKGLSKSLSRRSPKSDAAPPLPAGKRSRAGWLQVVPSGARAKLERRPITPTVGGLDLGPT